MPFNPEVYSFAQVTKKLRKINAHLEELSRFMASVDWSTVKRKPVGDGGSEPGNNPPKWPPK